MAIVRPRPDSVLPSSLQLPMALQQLSDTSLEYRLSWFRSDLWHRSSWTGRRHPFDRSPVVHRLELVGPGIARQSFQVCLGLVEARDDGLQSLLR